MSLPPPKPGKDPLAPWDNAFFITIGTNSTNTALIEPLRQVWRYLVSHLTEFIYGRPGSRLISVKAGKAGVEIGAKYHRVHLHSQLIYRTLGISNLDFWKINEFVNLNLRKAVPGFKRVNFHARLQPNYNANRNLEDYIEDVAQIGAEE